MTSAGGPQGPAQGYPPNTHAAPASLELRRPAERGANPGTRDVRGQAGHRRPGPHGRADARRAARPGPLPARRRARAWPRRWPWRPSPRSSAARSPASSSPPTWCPPTSSAPGSTGSASEKFDVELGPVVRQLPARRRDQPGAGQGAVGAARGHGRAAGVDRRQDVPDVPDAVPGDGHPEPDRAGGRLPAARGAARPVPDEDRRRLPDRRGGARDRLPDGRQAAGAASRCSTPGDLLASAGRGRRGASCTTRSSTTRSGWCSPPARRPSTACPTSRRPDPVRRQPARLARHRRAPPGRWPCCAAATTRSRRTCRRIAPDILRHRLVLTYDALADDISAETVINRILQTVGLPQVNAIPQQGHSVPPVVPAAAAAASGR